MFKSDQHGESLFESVQMSSPDDINHKIDSTEAKGDTKEVTTEE
jgi:hypothetical protein